MKRKSIIFITLLCCLLSGCRKEVPHQSRIVTNVTLGYNEEIFGQYHTEEKIQGVLVYLRGLELPQLHFGRQEPPVPLRHVFTLELTFADGRAKRYQQANHRFVRVDNGPWMEVDPQRCAELYHVLLAYPLDVSQSPVFRSLTVDLAEKLCYNNGNLHSQEAGYESRYSP